MDDGSQATPEQCLAFYNQNPRESYATQVAWVTFKQVADLEIPVKPDPLPARPSHILLDLTQVNQRKAGQALKHLAEQNGIIITPAR